MDHASMRLLFAALLLSASVGAQESPDTPEWAIPKAGPEPAQAGSDAKISLPGSALSLTQGEIDDSFNAPDWYPQEHAPMPRIVAHGNEPENWACAMCHLASGNGHPQSAKLAGTSADYIVRQLAAFKAGDRRSYLGDFIDNLHAMKDEKEAQLAAEWFASLPVRRFQNVIETDTVPETVFEGQFMRIVKTAADGTVHKEPIRGRIIEVPEDHDAVKARDPHASFVTYVPVGSLEKGKKLALEGSGGSAACVTCHGIDMRGTALAPALAGAFPTYIIRQLYDFRNGRRTGLADNTRFMSAMSRQLSDEDIVNVAAYIGSLSP